MVDLLKLIVIMGILIYNGYKNNGLKGVLDIFKSIFEITWGMLGILNVFSISISGDSIITKFFGGYITYILVGFILELINYKKGEFGRYFGKLFFWFLGIPVSVLLNFLAASIF